MDRQHQRRRDYFIPQDLISDILPRLPTAAATVRFRCVCKSWCRLFSDPNFIRRHLLSSKLHRDDDHGDEAPVVMVAEPKIPDANGLRYSLLSYDTLLPKTTPYHLPHNTFRGWAGWPIQEIVGCCNGLFCIADRWSRVDSAVTVGLILWNPSTSETKLLPPYKPGSRYITSGFGFDSSTGDYKVMRSFQDGIMNWFCEVYSLRSGSWKGVNDAYWRLKMFDWGTGGDWTHNKSNPGKIYCYRHSSYRDYIVCFDFREERFRHQYFPAGLVEGANFGQLHLAATSKEDSLMAVVRDKDDNLDIWGLLDYRSVESWTKLFRYDGSRLSGSIGIGSRMIGVLGDAGIVFIAKANGELLTIDFEKEKVSGDNGIRALSRNKHMLDVYCYVPSRVSIAGLSRQRHQD
ncbi:F-box/kelch-repeat protein At3g06240 [Linum grandiflorum]